MRRRDGTGRSHLERERLRLAVGGKPHRRARIQLSLP
jgi:hypothetical protein